MHIDELVLPHWGQVPVYQPGRPIEEVARHYHLDPATICKLASNENALGPSPLGQEAARAALENLHRYPDGGCFSLRNKLAERLRLQPEQLLFGNGSNEVIELAAHALLESGLETVQGEHAFPVYQIVTRLFGAEPILVPMPGLQHDLDAMLAAITPQTRIVFLPSPNNPTGLANDASDIEAFAAALPDHVLFLFDEAYAEYLERPPDLRPQIAMGRKILCTRTFSKIYGLAGLRIGYGYGPPELIRALERGREPFNVNLVAQEAALAALDDHGHLERSRAMNREGIAQLRKGLESLGLETVPSVANFVLVKVPDAQRAFDFLQRRGLITRPVPSLGSYLRVSVGLPEENERCLKAMADYLGER